MFGVLIVDDESVVRYGIRSMIDWEKIGLTVVGDAANGREALELYRRLNPEIVITDIKMPFMDGIELIQAIRALHAQTKIIILSCYEDFQYAREALRLGAAEYLIKSDMMPLDFENILIKIKDALSAERKNLASLAEFQEKMSETENLVKEKFLWDLSLGMIGKTDPWAVNIQRLGIDYLNDQFMVCNIGIDYFEKVAADFSEGPQKDLVTALESRIKETITGQERCRGEIYPGNSGEVNALLTVSQVSERHSLMREGHNLAEKMIDHLKTGLGVSVSIGLSECFSDIIRLKQAYSQAHQAYRYKKFYGCGQVIHYADTVNSKAKPESIRVKTKELEEDVFFLKGDRVRVFLGDLFERIDRNKDDDEVNMIALELLLVLNNIYADICKDNDAIAARKKEYYEQIKYLETVADFQNWFKTAYQQLIDYIQSVYNQDHNMIHKALNYIHNNYQRDMSLTEVSEHVHLSKNYLINLFKKETGESFVEYLTKHRIEKAKLLLESSNYKVADIGQMVGISDSHYFSKVFKKNTGLSPSEFKDKYRGR